MSTLFLPLSRPSPFRPPLVLQGTVEPVCRACASAQVIARGTAAARRTSAAGTRYRPGHATREGRFMGVLLRGVKCLPCGSSPSLPHLPVHEASTYQALDCRAGRNESRRHDHFRAASGEEELGEAHGTGIHWLHHAPLPQIMCDRPDPSESGETLQRAFIEEDDDLPSQR